MDNIALFPLKIVLFPESRIPLHIFENKYKRLINNSIDLDEPFGVNFKTSKKFRIIGCSAKVSEVKTRYNDGRMDIIIEGRRRYKIIKRFLGVDGYELGEVEYFEDESEKLDYKTMSKCVEVFNRIGKIVKSVQIEKLDPNELKTEKPSFYIAQKSGLNSMQKQELLQLRSENMRLVKLLFHLKRIIPMIKEAEYANQIVKNDGYYKPKYLKY